MRFDSAKIVCLAMIVLGVVGLEMYLLLIIVLLVSSTFGIPVAIILLLLNYEIKYVVAIVQDSHHKFMSSCQYLTLYNTTSTV